ncbi:esterase [Lonsdalea quercina]|uniref:esterase n=1 Tax=Lonsdalea quercina TaxID=71657 RepID=UPI003F456FF5
MKHEHVVVQQPSAPRQLFLIFHGVGDNPASMAEIGRYFANAFSEALVISVGSPKGENGSRCWFSVQDITEENRPERVQRVLPGFIETIRYWQKQSGINASHTALVGFSQGGIMILEALKAERQLAGRSVVFSGRYATLPEQPLSDDSVVHLLHGENDPVISSEYASLAAQRLQILGTDFTLDRVPELGHAIDMRIMDFALDRLRYYIPQRYWDEAVQGKRGELIAFR